MFKQEDHQLPAPLAEHTSQEWRSKIHLKPICQKSSPLRTFSSSAIDEHHKSDTDPKISTLQALRIEEPGESLRTPPPTPGTAGRSVQENVEKRR